MILYGLSGSNGSGKDSLGQYLALKHNFLFVSSSDLLRAEAIKQGRPTTREVLRDISASWRREYGLGVLVQKAIELFETQPGLYKGLVTGSLRNPAEVDAIHKYGGRVIWTDADPQIRFARLSSRGREDDPKDYDKFLAEEAAEQSHSGDLATLSMADVKAKSDIFIMNNSSSVEEFERQIDKELGTDFES